MQILYLESTNKNFPSNFPAIMNFDFIIESKYSKFEKKTLYHSHKENVLKLLKNILTLE